MTIHWETQQIEWCKLRYANVSRHVLLLECYIIIKAAEVLVCLYNNAFLQLFTIFSRLSCLQTTELQGIIMRQC